MPAGLFSWAGAGDGERWEVSLITIGDGEEQGGLSYVQYREIM